MPGVAGPSEVGVVTGAAAGAVLGVDRRDRVAMDRDGMAAQAESVGVLRGGATNNRGPVTCDQYTAVLST